MNFKKTVVVVFRVVCAALLVAVAMLVRAKFFLPPVDVPILLYDRVSETPDGKYTVLVENFHSQMSELAADGFKSVTPARLRAYATWGIPLPARPVMITFDTARRSLLSDVKPILKENGFTAVVNLATTYIADSPSDRRMLNGEPMMTWSEIRGEMADGVFIFGGHTRNCVDLARHVNPFNEIRASRFDIRKATGVKSGVFSYPFGVFTDKIKQDAGEAKIKFAMGYGEEVAKIGAGTDFLALPRLRVVGGRHVFSVDVVERITLKSSGVVRVQHPVGPPFPVSVVVYESGGGAQVASPVAVVESASTAPGEVLEVDLPLAVTFPISVFIYDINRVVWYFDVEVPRTAVLRPGGNSFTPPVELDYPVDIIPIEELDIVEPAGAVESVEGSVGDEPADAFEHDEPVDAVEPVATAPGENGVPNDFVL